MNFVINLLLVAIRLYWVLMSCIQRYYAELRHIHERWGFDRLSRLHLFDISRMSYFFLDLIWTVALLWAIFHVLASCHGYVHLLSVLCAQWIRTSRCNGWIKLWLRWARSCEVLNMAKAGGKQITLFTAFGQREREIPIAMQAGKGKLTRQQNTRRSGRGNFLKRGKMDGRGFK